MIPFKSFTKQPRLQLKPNSTMDSSVYAGDEEGIITKLYTADNNKYLADITLLSGRILTKTLLPGPFYSKEGFIHGHKPAYHLGQRVKVAYLSNRLDNPIVDQVYSYSVGKDGQNLKRDTVYRPNEVSTGHKSGHRTVWDENKLIHKDKTQKNVLTLDVSEESFTIEFKKAKLVFSKDKLSISFGEEDNVIEMDDSKVYIKGDLEVGKDITWNKDTIPTKASTHQHTGNLGANTSQPIQGT